MQHTTCPTRRTVLLALPLLAARTQAATDPSLPSSPPVQCELAVRNGIRLAYEGIVVVFKQDGISLEGPEKNGLPLFIPYADITKIVHKANGRTKWWHYLLLIPLVVVTGQPNLITILQKARTGLQATTNLRLDETAAYQLIANLERATGLTVLEANRPN